MSQSNNNPESEPWAERARELHECGGVPQKRAKVVALIEAGRTHQEVKDELGLGRRGEVSTHVSRYKDDLDEAEWLADCGPEI